jgi:hypothetical protein
MRIAVIWINVTPRETWPWERDIETGRSSADNHGHFPERSGREEYSYPAVLQGRDGQIYVAYTYRRMAMKVMSFDEDRIKHGATVGKFKGNRENLEITLAVEGLVAQILREPPRFCGFR